MTQAREKIGRFAPGLARISDPHAWTRRDLIASLAVWGLLVPQGLAYAELAGMPPVTGLYSALAGMTAYAIFGGGRYANVGPESAIAIVVAASLGPLAAGHPDQYTALAALLALMVAAFLALGALLRLGGVARLLSVPVLTGYLAGSGVVMLVKQVPKMLGYVSSGKYPNEIGEIVHHVDDANLWTIGIALLTIVVLLGTRRFLPGFPAPLIAVAVSTVVVLATNLDEHGVAVLGTIQGGLPSVGLPTGLRVQDIVDLSTAAVSLALLCFAGSVAGTRALAARDGEDLDANREFVGLSVANAAAGIVGGFPVAVSDSRSFTAAQSGQRSQVASVWGAVLMILTLLFLLPSFAHVPQAALGGVVAVAALGLFDIPEVRRLFKVRSADAMLALITFAGVLVVGVLEGIVIGIVASLIDVVRRTLSPRTAVMHFDTDPPHFVALAHGDAVETLPGLVVYRFEAPLFFGNAEVMRREILHLVESAPDPVRLFVLDGEGINDIDTSGADELTRCISELEAEGVQFAFARIRTPVRRVLGLVGIEERVGTDKIYDRVQDAIAAFRATDG